MTIIAAAAFILSSTTFKPNATLPKTTVYNSSGCSGPNVSPELHWSGAPANTQSFALVMHDPDAPAPGGWYHWVIYNLPASTHELPSNAQIPDTQLGMTSWDNAAYNGPCPPPGKPHHYVLTLYALDVASIPGSHLTGPQVETAVARHTIAKTTLVGLYGQ
jgi:Raf kinase inhibitor-like YbhB/YbcL family protein